jgi:CHAT domain-containing protein
MLSYQKESRLIKEVANGKNVGYKKSMATVEKLTDMLVCEPKILHISCHGITQTANGATQNYLLFEDEAGNGQLVSEESLRKLILRNLPNIGVVVVAACHSEFVGKIFQRIGARHVVCIDKDN